MMSSWFDKRRLSLVSIVTFTMMAAGWAPAQAQSVLEIGSPGVGDDYLCWAAVPARAVNLPSGSEVVISSRPTVAGAAAGTVLFSVDRNLSHATGELTLTVPGGATSVDFFVAGTTASQIDNDIELVVTDASGQTLATNQVMVRVRKNAETLTAEERDRFLRAFATAGNLNDQFSKYWALHSDAVRMAHQHAFLPWHRALLLQIEREIQAVDPSVALPYWAFDAPAPNVFSPDFMGAVGGPNPTLVSFSATNPLAGLHFPILPLTRNNNGNVAVPGITKQFMRAREEVPLINEMWSPYHGSAHTFIGGIVGDISRSPADPLFFLLHANVDRGWAAWQRTYDKFDREDPTAYWPQGPFQPGMNVLLGGFEEDTMWPWDGVERPDNEPVETAGRIVMPVNPGPDTGIGEDAQVGEYLDYLDTKGDGAGHGFCYDDIAAGTGPVAAFPELP